MFDPSSFANLTPLVHADTSMDVLLRGGTSQWHPTRFNLYDPQKRNVGVFIVWPEVYCSGSENVTEFLEGIDNKIMLLEIPSDLSCAYLKGPLLGRALDWYQIFGSALVQNTATDFAQLKAALSKAFLAIQNRKDLEARFYASQKRQKQELTDFVYDLLKLQKKLELGMSEKALWGCGSPVVKVSNHGRHVMSSIPVPLKTRRVGKRCMLNLSRAETSSRWCGVVVRRGGCQLRCRPRHLTMVQNYVVRRQKPSCS
ncbi:uncharacterized protein TNCV_2534911 [Trichonephila clavipes]|nr:uncharacterized protein TNCV_2534911 [Trichonephila clavipes]